MTIEEIARLAGVSRSTVSRVLNSHPNVRPQVRARVLAVIQQQGYVPQAAARSLASRRTRVIGLVIPHTAARIFDDPFFGPVIHSITEACAALGYFVMLAMLTHDREPSFYERVVRGRHFDGMIMLSSDIDDPLLPLLMRDRLPLVLFGSHPYFDELSWVDADHRSGVREAIRYLVGLGHRHIATITGPLTMQSALDRRDGYKQGLLEAGLPIRQELIAEGDWTQQSGYRALQHLLQVPVPPTAVFVASDSMAVGAMRAAAAAGYRIPDDLSIVGFDDLPFAAYTSPPLTTIHQPVGDMGATAVRLLVELIEHRASAPQQVRLPTRLVVRESCRAIAAWPENRISTAR